MHYRTKEMVQNRALALGVTGLGIASLGVLVYEMGRDSRKFRDKVESLQYLDGKEVTLRYGGNVKVRYQQDKLTLERISSDKIVIERFYEIEGVGGFQNKSPGSFELCVDRDGEGKNYIPQCSFYGVTDEMRTKFRVMVNQLYEVAVEEKKKRAEKEETQ